MFVYNVSRGSLWVVQKLLVQLVKVYYRVKIYQMIYVVLNGNGVSRNGYKEY